MSNHGNFRATVVILEHFDKIRDDNWKDKYNGMLAILRIDAVYKKESLLSSIIPMGKR